MRASYILEILVVGYQNPEHLQVENGWCCERTHCSSPCDNALVFCFRQISMKECEMSFATGLIEYDNDNLTFQEGDSIGRLTNPLMVSGIVSPVSGIHVS